MYVVASLLDPAATLQTQQLWDNLHDACGLAGIRLTPLPHFTWQAAADYDDDSLEFALQNIANNLRPFSISSSGLGIFTGDAPVLYAPLVKNRVLIDAHDLIWKALAGAGSGINKHYHPENWIPHVTLAYRDVTPSNLDCALSVLAFQPLVMDILVDHIAVLYDIDGQIGMKARYEFSAK